jgi:hypothetical protein
MFYPVFRIPVRIHIGSAFDCRLDPESGFGMRIRNKVLKQLKGRKKLGQNQCSGYSKEMSKYDCRYFNFIILS